jgi:hypothetical protein
MLQEDITSPLFPKVSSFFWSLTQPYFSLYTGLRSFNDRPLKISSTISRVFQASSHQYVSAAFMPYPLFPLQPFAFSARDNFAHKAFWSRRAGLNKSQQLLAESRIFPIIGSAYHVANRPLGSRSYLQGLSDSTASVTQQQLLISYLPQIQPSLSCSVDLQIGYCLAPYSLRNIIIVCRP